MSSRAVLYVIGFIVALILVWKAIVFATYFIGLLVCIVFAMLLVVAGYGAWKAFFK